MSRSRFRRSRCNSRALSRSRLRRNGRCRRRRSLCRSGRSFFARCSCFFGRCCGLFRSGRGFLARCSCFFTRCSSFFWRRSCFFGRNRSSCRCFVRIAATLCHCVNDLFQDFGGQLQLVVLVGIEYLFKRFVGDILVVEVHKRAFPFGDRRKPALFVLIDKERCTVFGRVLAAVVDSLYLYALVLGNRGGFVGVVSVFVKQRHLYRALKGIQGYYVVVAHFFDKYTEAGAVYRHARLRC